MYEFNKYFWEFKKKGSVERKIKKCFIAIHNYYKIAFKIRLCFAKITGMGRKEIYLRML